MVFDLRRKTAQSQSYARNTSDSRNLFYATMAGSEFADETLTVTYTREGEETPTGIRRREKHLSISADTPMAGQEYDELRRLALIEMVGFQPAESFACDIIEGPYPYGADYRVGNLVSVQNQAWGVVMEGNPSLMSIFRGSIGAGRAVSVSFTATGWKNGVLTIPRAEHGRQSGGFGYALRHRRVDGALSGNTWAVLGTDVAYDTATGVSCSGAPTPTPARSPFRDREKRGEAGSRELRPGVEQTDRRPVRAVGRLAESEGLRARRGGFAA